MAVAAFQVAVGKSVAAGSLAEVASALALLLRY